MASELAHQRFAGPLFSGQAIPAQLRFSMAGGNPRVPDNTRSPRGLAAQFQLPDGSLHHIAMLTTPVFGAKDPDSFLGLLRAQRPGPDGKPNAGTGSGLPGSTSGHPAPGRVAGQQPTPVELRHGHLPWPPHLLPANPAGAKLKVRWHLQPQDGEKGLSAAEIADAPADFLPQRLAERLRQGPVRFDWIMVFGEAEDSDDDPSRPWPAARPVLKIGTLSIRQVGRRGLHADQLRPQRDERRLLGRQRSHPAHALPGLCRLLRPATERAIRKSGSRPGSRFIVPADPIRLR